MIPESLKIRHWLSEVPLPFTIQIPQGPESQQRPQDVPGRKITPDWRHPVSEYLSGMVRCFTKWAPTSYKWGYNL